MFTRDFFTGKCITVMGLGLNQGGVGTVRFLAEMGAKEIIVTDLKTENILEPSIAALKDVRNIRWVLGEHRERDFIETDLVIKNPGLPWTNPFVQIAKTHGVPVTLDAGIFFDLCPAPIIGVTGTKGKTTTASLIAHILEQAGKSVVRVGISQISVLGELGRVTPDSLVVFELSSWRLSALAHIEKSPTVAVVTNIYPDHQNSYTSMEAYVEDKKYIFRFQLPSDTVVLNAENDWTRAMAKEAPSRVIWFGQQAITEEETESVTLRGQVVVETRSGVESESVTLERTPFQGTHQRGNVLAAIGAVRAFQLSESAIQQGLNSFPGVPHRLEWVAQKKGIRFYNDSAATIPEATIAALQSFATPVYLIAGGSDKELDFTRLAEVIVEEAKGVVFLKGSGTDKLVEAMQGAFVRQGIPPKRCVIVESLDKALEFVTRSAETGDTVVLSPGAASFGLFQNEFDRGEQFRRCVQALPD